MTRPAASGAVSFAVVAAIVLPYLLSFRRRRHVDRARKQEAILLGIDRPTAQFPFIDAMRCIGCGTCVDACPEGDVLGVVGGTATVVNGLRCIGHARCEIACPVGAIEVGLGDLKSRERRAAAGRVARRRASRASSSPASWPAWRWSRTRSRRAGRSSSASRSASPRRAGAAAGRVYRPR